MESSGLGPKLIRINDIKASGVPEGKWIIKDHLPAVSLAMLAGPPKIGKSRLSFSLAVDICLESKFLGKLQCNPKQVALISFEESSEEIKEKTQMALLNRGLESDYKLNLFVPDDLRVLNDWDISVVIEDIILENDIGIVIIDPLGRSTKDRYLIKANSYINDYQFLGELQNIALDYGICVMVIHHTRKSFAEDPMDAVLGSRGVTAPADTIWVLHSRRNNKATLFIKGRNLKEKNYEIIFDDESLEWQLSENQNIDLNLSPERKEIIDLFMKNKGKELSSSFIAQELNKDQPNISQMLRKMVIQRILQKGSRYGYYKLQDD